MLMLRHGSIGLLVVPLVSIMAMMNEFLVGFQGLEVAELSSDSRAAVCARLRAWQPAPEGSVPRRRGSS